MIENARKPMDRDTTVVGVKGPCILSILSGYDHNRLYAFTKKCGLQIDSVHIDWKNFQCTHTFPYAKHSINIYILDAATKRGEQYTEINGAHVKTMEKCRTCPFLIEIFCNHVPRHHQRKN
eukprot:Pompholyxophrys_sp_v1_NODE_131_length_1692_cov_2.154551.p3 type:complete len:121 gc:universal NODE_131_length_1692_cov_2.154551:1155-793(-)